MSKSKKSNQGIQSIWVGSWSYRSFNNNPDLTADPNSILFGQGTIEIVETDMPNELSGRIYGPGWQLELTGSLNYGDPCTARFQGKGIVSGSEWIYEYIGYFSNPWQNGIDQVPSFTGSVCRQIPHPGGDGGLHPAGVVASFFCIEQ